MSKIKVKDIELIVLDEAYELAAEYRIIKEILFPLPAPSKALCIERDETGTYISAYTFRKTTLGHHVVRQYPDYRVLVEFKDLIACGIIEVIE